MMQTKIEQPHTRSSTDLQSTMLKPGNVSLFSPFHHFLTNYNHNIVTTTVKKGKLDFAHEGHSLDLHIFQWSVWMARFGHLNLDLDDQNLSLYLDCTENGLSLRLTFYMQALCTIHRTRKYNIKKKKTINWILHGTIHI